MGSIMAYATCASEQQGLTQLSHALDPDSLLAAGGHLGRCACTEHPGLALWCLNLPYAVKEMAVVHLCWQLYEPGYACLCRASEHHGWTCLPCAMELKRKAGGRQAHALTILGLPSWRLMIPSAMRERLVEVPFVHPVSTRPPHACAAPLSCKNLLPCPGAKQPPGSREALGPHVHALSSQGCLSATADMSCWQQASAVHTHARPVHHRAVGNDPSLPVAWPNLPSAVLVCAGHTVTWIVSLSRPCSLHSHCNLGLS